MRTYFALVAFYFFSSLPAQAVDASRFNGTWAGRGKGFEINAGQYQNTNCEFSFGLEIDAAGTELKIANEEMGCYTPIGSGWGSTSRNTDTYKIVDGQIFDKDGKLAGTIEPDMIRMTSIDADGDYRRDSVFHAMKDQIYYSYSRSSSYSSDFSYVDSFYGLMDRAINN